MIGGSELHVRLAHPRRIDIEIPVFGSGIVHAHVESCLRSAADTVVLYVDHLGGVGVKSVFKRTCALGVVLIAVGSHRSGCGEGDGRGDLEGHADLYALVAAAHSGEHVVGECRIVVVVEGRALHSIVEFGPVAGDSTAETAVVPAVGEIGRQDAFALGIGDDVVLDAGRDVDAFDQRSMGAVFGMGHDVVAAVDLVGGAHLGHGIIKAVCGAASQRVLRRASVAHVAVAVELGVAHVHTVVDVPVGQIDHVLDPGIGLDGVDIVVISELVAFVDLAVGIVEIVLEQLGREGDVAVGEGVDVEPELAAHEVAHGLVV